MLDTSSATWPEVRDQLKRKPVAVIAVGAQEEHGPHLPLSTDTVQSAELARRLAEALDLMLLPYIPLYDKAERSKKEKQGHGRSFAPWLRKPLRSERSPYPKIISEPEQLPGTL